MQVRKKKNQPEIEQNSIKQTIKKKNPHIEQNSMNKQSSHKHIQNKKPYFQSSNFTITIMGLLVLSFTHMSAHKHLNKHPHKHRPFPSTTTTNTNPLINTRNKTLRKRTSHFVR